MDQKARLLCTKDAARYICLSVKQMYCVRLKDKTFPKPIKVSTDIRGKCLYVKCDLDAWIDNKKKALYA